VNVAVVGGGIFGCTAALRLAKDGHRVSLFERQGSLMQGASGNSHGRIHRGYHYPRSPETISQCKDGFERFVREFGSCVTRSVGIRQSGFDWASDWNDVYLLMKEGSLTSANEFHSVCQRHGLPYCRFDPRSMPVEVRGVEACFLADEAIFDADKLAVEVEARLRAEDSVSVRLSTSVESVWSANNSAYTREVFPDSLCLSLQGGGITGQYSLPGWDAVVNCTYADVNRLTVGLGFGVRPLRFESTAQLVVEMPAGFPRLGLSVMDSQERGVVLSPHGSSGKYLLYHVAHSVIAMQESLQVPREWLRPESSPFASVDRGEWEKRMIAGAAEFVPVLSEARPVGVLQSPRMVPAHSDERDERPTLVTVHSPRYLTVHAGKVDTSLQAADAVAHLLGDA